jgi:protein-L-isoaspartate(D-aspartate) O-methyltransferase
MRNRARIVWESAALVALAVLCAAAPAASAQTKQEWARLRNQMVDRELIEAGLKSPRVIEAMRNTPRHEFVPASQRPFAYYDMALPIGHAQTISAPFIVAYMTEQIDPQPTDTVLEIGTGSGYQAAVLSGLVKEVYTIEIVEPLGNNAERDLKRLKYDNVHVKVGDGFKGWPEHAPFDKIIVTCSPERVPPALVAQLREGGRMIVPVGTRYQQTFYMLRKVDGQLQTESLRSTLFVPMTGEAEKRRQVKPDPTKPSLANGDFEEVDEKTQEAVGWHYPRQMALLTEGAPSGKHYAAFTNKEAGRGAQALQGFAVDGRVVRNLKLLLWVSGKDVQPGQNAQQLPMLAVVFYDDRRDIVGEGMIGPWKGTFPWQRKTGRMAVPPKAREAIVRIGMWGATGELWLDAIQMEPDYTRDKPTRIP